MLILWKIFKRENAQPDTAVIMCLHRDSTGYRYLSLSLSLFAAIFITLLAIKGLDWGSDIPLTAGIIFVLDLQVQSLPLVLTTSPFAAFIAAVFFCCSSISELFQLPLFFWALVSVPLWWKILCVQLCSIRVCTTGLIVALFNLLSSTVIWGSCRWELKNSKGSAVKQSIAQGFA